MADRCIGFGFMAGKEIKEAGVGNLGLHDRAAQTKAPFEYRLTRKAERLALRWVNKYISNFGGDPSKVTMSVKARSDVSIS